MNDWMKRYYDLFAECFDDDIKEQLNRAKKNKTKVKKRKKE